MKKSPLRTESKSDTAQCKKRIQALCRQIALKRDGGCVLTEFQNRDGVPFCNGYSKAGELILQFDHLNSRAHNVSYGEPRLGVIVCKGHHTWKTFRAKKQYDEIIKSIISPERVKLWEAVEADTRPHPMLLWDWQKVEIYLSKLL